MDGWMFFVETAQGIWYDQRGNPQAAAAQVSGIGEGLSEPLPASYVASERYKENERLKKEINERIKREREEKNHKRFEDLKKKWKLEGRQRPRLSLQNQRPRVQSLQNQRPRAKGSEPVSKATSSAPQPNVKAMPNPYMSYQYCAEHSSVTIEELSTSSECEQIAIPHPKRHQQFKTYDAAMKRQKKQ